MAESRNAEWKELDRDELADHLGKVGLSPDGVQLHRLGLEEILFAARMGPGSSAWHPVAGTYVTFKDQPERYVRFVLAINEACGFHSHLSGTELETADPSPLGVSYVINRFRPQAEAVLKGLSLGREEAPDLVEDADWGCLEEVTELSCGTTTR